MLDWRDLPKLTHKDCPELEWIPGKNCVCRKTGKTILDVSEAACGVTPAPSAMVQSDPPKWTEGRGLRPRECG
jgi:hypothetical protein